MSFSTALGAISHKSLNCALGSVHYRTKRRRHYVSTFIGDNLLFWIERNTNNPAPTSQCWTGGIWYCDHPNKARKTCKISVVISLYCLGTSGQNVTTEGNVERARRRPVIVCIITSGQESTALYYYRKNHETDVNFITFDNSTLAISEV